MSPIELLQEAELRGLTLNRVGDNLHVIPRRLCSTDFAERLRSHKQDLLALLTKTSSRGGDASHIKLQRPLTEREWAILVRAGAEDDPIVIEALRLFDGRIVE